MNIIKRVYAFLTRRKLVWLQDFDDEETLSIARKGRFGDVIADRTWPFGIKIVKLLDNGVVDGVYVKNWKYDSEVS